MLEGTNTFTTLGHIFTMVFVFMNKSVLGKKKNVLGKAICYKK